MKKRVYGHLGMPRVSNLAQNLKEILDNLRNISLRRRKESIFLNSLVDLLSFLLCLNKALHCLNIKVDYESAL